MQSQDDGIDQRQEHLGHTVISVASGIGQVPSEKVTKLQHSYEFLEKVSAAKVRQARMITSNFQVAWRPTHSEPHLTKCDVRLRIPRKRENPLQMALLFHSESCEYAGFRYEGYPSPPSSPSPNTQDARTHLRRGSRKTIFRKSRNELSRSRRMVHPPGKRPDRSIRGPHGVLSDSVVAT